MNVINDFPLSFYDQLRKVQIGIDSKPYNDTSLTSLISYYDQMLEVATSVLDNYGIEYDKLPLPQRGGGDGPLIEIILSALKAFKLLRALIMGVALAKQIAVRYMSARAQHSDVVYDVVLTLQAEGPSQSAYELDAIQSSLPLLKRLADNMCEDLRKKYPAFKFGQRFNVLLKYYAIDNRYLVKPGDLTNYKTNSLINVMHRWRLLEGVSDTVSFKKFLIQTRRYHKYKIIGHPDASPLWFNDFKRTKSRKFYTLISSRPTIRSHMPAKTIRYEKFLKRRRRYDPTVS